MKIEQSAVTMNASHSFSSESEVRFNSATSFRTIYDSVSQAGEASSDAERQAELLLMLEGLIARMLEFISGNGKSRVTDLREVLATEDTGVAGQSAHRPARVVEMGWESAFTERVSEHESTDFSSTGKIQTADGRTLDFKLDLAMCRDYQCERTTKDGGTVVLRDPLVINFDGKAAELSGKRFEFDLDADGKTEALQGLSSGSAYLAIDANADGRINDGSELFGTRSGNGFADLAKFDSDGSSWLDESDAAFDTLRIWQRDADGKDTLSRLRDKGVGALYLGSVETPFSLTDSENRMLAQIRASGVYLREDGRAGSLQQVDLAV